jgi:hypothetical protein
MNFSKILMLMVRVMFLGWLSYIHMAMACQGGYPQSQHRRQGQSRPFMSEKKGQYKQRMMQNNHRSSLKSSHHQDPRPELSSQNRQFHSRNNFNRSQSRMPRNSYGSSRENTFSALESNHRGLSSPKRRQGSSGRRGGLREQAMQKSRIFLGESQAKSSQRFFNFRKAALTSPLVGEVQKIPRSPSSYAVKERVFALAEKVNHHFLSLALFIRESDFSRICA